LVVLGLLLFAVAFLAGAASEPWPSLGDACALLLSPLAVAFILSGCALFRDL
jgi:hypothetical protein